MKMGTATCRAAATELGVSNGTCWAEVVGWCDGFGAVAPGEGVELATEADELALEDALELAADGGELTAEDDGLGECDGRGVSDGPGDVAEAAEAADGVAGVLGIAITAMLAITATIATATSDSVSKLC